VAEIEHQIMQNICFEKHKQPKHFLPLIPLYKDIIFNKMALLPFHYILYNLCILSNILRSTQFTLLYLSLIDDIFIGILQL